MVFLTPTSQVAPAAAAVGSIPLVVDLDGTLVSTDLAVESIFTLGKENPLQLLLLPFWAIKGPAVLKQRLAHSATLNAATLPYDSEFLAYIKSEREKGRRLVLATAANEKIAHAVASELGIFDDVFASDEHTNLSGPAKRDRLIAAFGDRGFDYAGNAPRDSSIWAAARNAILVGVPERFAATIGKSVRVERIFAHRPTTLSVYLQALRPHHWLKNLLVFAPLVATQRLYDPARFLQALLAFCIFSLCASSIYVLNDLMDLAEDRRHPRKKNRVIASGRLPAMDAAMIIPVLLVTALLLTPALSGDIVATAGIYVVLMVAYCIKLRALPMWDTATLAVGYSLRLWAGALAAASAIPAWSLWASVLFFFGLSLLKRFAEAVAAGPQSENARIRGYALTQRWRVAALGGVATSSGLIVAAGYGAQQPLYARTGLMWVFWIVLTGWLVRMWVMAGRGKIDGDPVTFAINDPASRVAGLLMVLIALAVG